MVEYKCFSCGKTIPESHIKKKIRCIYCGGKIIYKPRTTITHVKAR